jgi:hypothetical protein
VGPRADMNAVEKILTLPGIEPWPFSPLIVAVLIELFDVVNTFVRRNTPTFSRQSAHRWR